MDGNSKQKMDFWFLILSHRESLVHSKLFIEVLEDKICGNYFC